MALRNPADIARETLKLLAARKLPPTPENYQAVYEEVAGLLPQVPFPLAPLRRIAAVLPNQTPAQKRITQLFASAVEAQDWTGLQSAIADYAQLDLGLAPDMAAHAHTNYPKTLSVLPDTLAQQLARVLEVTMAALGDEDHRMREITDQLVNFLRSAPPPLQVLEQMLHNYSYRLSFTSEDQAQRRLYMHDLLRMVAVHLASIASQDTQLQLHAQALTSAMDKPWSLTQLDLMQTHLKNLLFRHLEMESSRTEAHEQLKDLLGQHTMQMSHLGKLSDKHAHALQTCAQQIQQSQELGELASVLESVVQSGHALATENRAVQAHLADLREQIHIQETQIALLAQSLQEVQASTRHDPETGVLNLQGLKEAMFGEAARARRAHQVTTMACLHLGQLATLQHSDGANVAINALTHATRVARGTLRPQDALARVAQDQLVILFPNTNPNEAAQALGRLQAQLQQRSALIDKQALTIKFSAGVIALSEHESPAEALQRAQAACEQAQRMGDEKIALF